MLCMNSYKKEYIEACNRKMEAQLKAYRALVTTARTKGGAADSAIDAFEPVFFGNLVVVLDGYFVHRSRALEGKDGNPLNEVRILCNSILQHDGVLTADKTIKFNSEKSATKLTIGALIRLREADFVRLFEAFFVEMGAKFV